MSSPALMPAPCRHARGACGGGMKARFSVIFCCHRDSQVTCRHVAAYNTYGSLSSPLVNGAGSQRHGHAARLCMMAMTAQCGMACIVICLRRAAEQTHRSIPPRGDAVILTSLVAFVIRTCCRYCRLFTLRRGPPWPRMKSVATRCVRCRAAHGGAAANSAHGGVTFCVKMMLSAFSTPSRAATRLAARAFHQAVMSL